MRLGVRAAARRRRAARERRGTHVWRGCQKYLIMLGLEPNQMDVRQPGNIGVGDQINARPLVGGDLQLDMAAVGEQPAVDRTGDHVEGGVNDRQEQLVRADPA